MDIFKSPCGKIVTSPKGYDAFLPDPLPPEVYWNNEIINLLSRSDFILGKLARESKNFPNPHLLMRPFITREAVLSSQIEGTKSTIGDILAVDAGSGIKENPADLQEVQNYIKALDYGLTRIKEFPLSLRLIKEIHGHLMQGVRGSHVTPGEFRTSQNWTGPAGCTINTAKFVPPPPDNLMECLGKLEIFFYNKDLPPLIHVALCHYQFEAIHPFLDGNGRMGRLLITILMIEHKLLPSPILYLSAFFEASRDEYYKNLFNVSAKGTWNEWFIYFLNGVVLQAQDVLSRTERINELLDGWKEKVGMTNSSVPVEIIEHFAINPFFTTKNLAQTLGVAYTTIQRATLKLEAAGIIKQTNDDKRNKLYCATEILKILEEPTKMTPDL